jgi:hypothetical protein
MRAYMSRRSYGQKTLSKYHLIFPHAYLLTCQLPRSSSVPSRLCSSSTPLSTYGRDIWKLEPIQILSIMCATTTVQPPLPANLLRRTSLGSRLSLRMLSTFLPRSKLTYSVLKLVLLVAFATAIAAGVLVGRDLSQERQRKVITNLLKASYIMTLGKSPPRICSIANPQPSPSSPSSPS